MSVKSDKEQYVKYPILKYLRKQKTKVAVKTAIKIFPIYREVVKPTVAWVIYGTKKEVKMFIDADKNGNRPISVPCGVFKDSNASGIIYTTTYSAEELEENPEKVREFKDILFKELPSVKMFALAGKLPIWFNRDCEDIDSRFPDGSTGTRMTILGSALLLSEKSGIQPHEQSIVLIGGAGRIASQCIQDLALHYKTIYTIDPRFTEDYSETIGSSTIYYSSKPDFLKVADIGIVLTSSGEDIRDIIPHFKKGMLVADDTHPCIKKDISDQLIGRGVDLWKSAMTHDKFKTIPKVPNYNSNSIAGCLLEAMVLSKNDDSVLSDLNTFMSAAKEMGYKAQLIRHPHDT